MCDPWQELEETIKECTKCDLCKTRANVVIGVGNRKAKLMFIGEGPGAEEDREGIPFVGRAGKLMDMAFLGLGIAREEVYIANIVKCRPPQNRNPEPQEAQSCKEYIDSQIKLVNPEVIVLLGSVALQNRLGNGYSITKARGTWIAKDGIEYMPTFHPAALLRDESKKLAFWRDLKKVKKRLS